MSGKKLTFLKKCPADVPPPVVISFQMRITATPEDAGSTRGSSENQHRRKPATDSAESITSRVFREGNGRGLLKFCSELAVFLIRRYASEGNGAINRKDLSKSLVATLQCSERQAECVIDLSLEMIYARSHGSYRRSELELSYLIAIATGAVEDVSDN